jgi:plastocyanin
MGSARCAYRDADDASANEEAYVDRDPERTGATVAEARARYQDGQIDRRTLARMVGSLGLAGAAVAAGIGSSTTEARQDATPAAAGEPPPVATPVLGEQADGTRVWRVQAGAFDMVEMVEAMGFFPQEITINAGDTIFFDVPAFHTVTFLSGEERPWLIVLEEPTAGTPAAGEPRAVINPMAGFPVGGNTYDGTGYVNSGTPDPSAPPFTLTFTAPGSFEYLCLVHPQMKGKVIVQDAGAELSSDQAAYDQLASEQIAAMLDEGYVLIAEYEAATPEAGAAAGVHEVTAGVGSEMGVNGGAEALRFLPREVAIAVGDTVRWTNRSMHEPHTVTFLGGDPPPEFISVEPQAAGPPTLVLGSDVIFRVGGDTYDGTGLTGSGAFNQELAEFSDEFERTATYELTFTAPGEYRYYCAFHSGGPDDEMGMTGTVTVT